MIKSTALHKLIKSSVLLAFSFALGLSGNAANTPDSVLSGQTDLTAGATYQGGVAPTATSDVVFTANGYAPATFTIGSTTAATALSIGTLDDLSTQATLTINNFTGAADTLTLKGGSNSVAPNPSDLLYVITGDTLNIGNAASGTLSLVLASSGNLDIAGTSTIGSIISGTNGLTKTNSGALTLSGANTYSGTTAVNGGTLTLSGSAANSTGLAVSGGTFAFTKAASSQTFTNTAINQGASSITTVTADTLALGAITEAAGGVADFTPAGTGAITTSNTNTNGILGGWATTGGLANYATVNGSGDIVAYTLYTPQTFASGDNTSITGPETITSGTTNSLYFGTTGTTTLTLSGTNTIQSGGILVTSTPSGTSTIMGGTIEAGSGNAFYISASKAITIGSVLADNGSATSVTYDLQAGGTFTANGTYTGATYVDNTGSGFLTLSNSGGAFGTGILYLGVDGSANNAQINNTANGTVTETLANSLIVVANGSGTRLLRDGNGGTDNIVYTGNITLDTGATLTLLSGNSNTNGITLGSSTGSITGAGNLLLEDTANNRAAMVTFNGLVDNAGTITNGGTSAAVPIVNFVGSIGSAVTSLSQTSTGQTGAFASVMTLSAANSFTGPITIGAGSTLAVTGAGSLGNNGTFTGSGTTTAFTAGTTNNDTGTIADSGTFTYSGTSTQILSGAFTGGSTAVFNDTGTGVLALTANAASNTFSGATTIGTGATLQLGTGGLTGSLPSSAITDKGTLAIDRSNTVTQGTDFTAAAGLAGVGGLSQIGTGTTILTGANTYAGATLISAGALQLGNGSTNGTLATTSAITDNGTLIFDENSAVVQGAGFNAAAITGTGAVTVEGTGAVTFNAANTFTSLLDLGTVNFTTAAASGAQSLGTGTITLGSAGTSAALNYTGSGTATLGDALTVATSGTGTITNNGSSILTLAGAISKNGSVLNLVGVGANSGFNVSGSITGSMAGSDLNVINAQVTLSAANSYNGPTTVSGNATDAANSDVLQTAVANALPTATVVTLGSTSLETSPTEGYINILDLDGTSQSITGLVSANNSGDTNEVENSASGTSTLTITPTAGSNNTFGGTVGATGAANVAVVINGSSTGTQTFTGANINTGGVTVTAGTLLASNASALGAGNVTVNGGNLLGTVPNINIAGKFSLSSGMLQENTAGLGQFTLTSTTSSFAVSGGTWKLDITGSGNDSVVADGAAGTSFNISGGILDLTSDTLVVGDTYTILSGFGSGTGAGFSSILVSDPSHYSVTFSDSTPGVGVLIVSAPEPTTWAMLLGGVVLLVTIQRRRRASRV